MDSRGTPVHCVELLGGGGGGRHPSMPAIIRFR